MKLQSRACQSDPFSLSVCFSSHPPLADTAAPNFSLRSIRINLIKMSKEKKHIEVDSDVLLEPLAQVFVWDSSG